MKSALERKWWFVMLVSMLAVFTTRYLMDGAGMGLPHGFAQWAVFFLCFAALHKSFSMALWFLVVALSPADKVRERTR